MTKSELIKKLQELQISDDAEVIVPGLDDYEILTEVEIISYDEKEDKIYLW